MAQITEIQKKPETQVDRLKKIINSDSVNEQFRNALQDNAPLFIASLIDIYASDNTLQKCEPKTVVMEALKAATLKLPINRNLGFAYIVPYKGKATMQVGYKGYLQLAQRTGQYKYINADAVYEGELKKTDKLTGEIDLSGEAVSDKLIGFFAHMETISGFRKTVYWSADKVTAHAKRYSQSFNSSFSPWQSNFESMALKTVLKALLSKYGIMSIDMVSAISEDQEYEERVQQDIDEHANSEIIDLESVETSDGMTDEEKAEAIALEQAEAAAGPGF